MARLALVLLLLGAPLRALPPEYEAESETEASIVLPGETVERHGRLVSAQPVGARGGAWRLAGTRVWFFDEEVADGYLSHRLPDSLSVRLRDTVQQYGVVLVTVDGVQEPATLEHLALTLSPGTWVTSYEAGSQFIHEIDHRVGTYRLTAHPDRKRVTVGLGGVTPYPVRGKSCSWFFLPWNW